MTTPRPSGPMVLGMLLLTAAVSWSATMTASDGRETLIRQNTLDPFSVGLQFDAVKRDLKFENGRTARLDAYVYSAIASYEFLDRVTLFGTLGGCQAKVGNADKRGSDKVKWSGGLHVNVWQIDIEDPEFMAGRCSIRALGEYGQFRSGNPEQQSVEWSDWFGTLTLNYEIFTTKPGDIGRYPYSLALAVGPAVSKISGHVDSHGARDDFDESHRYGIAGSVVVFAAHNLSLGGHLQYYFDAVTAGGSIVYSF